jgi:hypothetical protein
MRRRAFIAGGAAWAVNAQDWRHSEAFQRLYNLDFEQAIPLLEKDCAAQPGEPDHHNNLAYAILYRTLFNADALDGGVALSVADFLHRAKAPMANLDRQRFEAALSKAEDAARKRGERADAIYALGVSQTHRANLSLLVDKEWRAALKTGGEASKLHAKALEFDRGFVDAMLVPSFHEYIVGSLPIYLKALGFLVGFTGDKEKGLKGLRKVAQYGTRAKLEAQVLLALVENREQRPAAAIEIMRGLEREFPTNHLYRKELATLLIGTKRKDEAKREFAELADSRYRFLKQARLESYKREFEAKLKA